MKTTLNTTEEKMNIDALKSMIESCYTYGGASKETYNFSKYISPYIDRLGNDMFEKIYTEHMEYLVLNCSVVDNVYTDCEGLSYSTLVKRA